MFEDFELGCGMPRCCANWRRPRT